MESNRDRRPYGYEKLLADIKREEEATPMDPGMIREAIDRINKRIEKFKPEEKTVISLYYGLETELHLTIEETGRVLNKRPEWVRRIKNKALQKLRFWHKRGELGEI